LSEPDEFVYGTIKNFDSHGMIVILELHVPFWGVQTASAMKYNVTKLTEPEYVLAIMMTDMKNEQTEMRLDKMECDHNWIPAGRSFLTDKMWYDCKICGEKKGG
jgi:hypothetical protein